MNRNSPIGIMDSGIGGLTVAKAIKTLLPHESLYYFGDTAHLPYGDKSSKAIAQYSHQIAEFLFNKGCKLLVIACNSASASAYLPLAKKWGTDQVLNVIDPLVQSIADQHPKHIGIIGTKRTISSGVYTRKFNECGFNDVSSLPTPLLASMIEEGFIDDKISHLIIKNYLSNPILNGIDILLLACTHYPLIRKEIKELLPKQLKVPDCTSSIAEAVYTNLKARKLLNDQSEIKSNDHFWVSDFTKTFQKTAQMFFGEKIQLEEHCLI